MAFLNLLSPDLTIDQVRNLVKECSVHERSDLGETCLHIQNDIDVVRYLLEQGANPNARTIMGNTPLHYKRSPEIVDLLLNAGASINLINTYGNTALHKQTDKESVLLLLKAGADLTVKNIYGKIPRDVNSHVPHHAVIHYIIFVLFLAWLVKYLFF